MKRTDKAPERLPIPDSICRNLAIRSSARAANCFRRSSLILGHQTEPNQHQRQRQLGSLSYPRVDASTPLRLCRQECRPFLLQIDQPSTLPGLP